MKLSVSNIAWEPKEKDDALIVLKNYGIKNLEIAPTLLFENILTADYFAIKNIRKFYDDRNLTLVAMQSLLYGGPNYSIFDKPEQVTQLLRYLKKIIDLSSFLGVKDLVFGSPKNRLIKNLADSDNETKATFFFKQLSELAAIAKVNICLEANPKEYGCNFITNTFEAIEFVKKVNQSNFKLNLDTNAILMNEENLEKVIEKASTIIGHIHISAPYLGEIDDENINHNYLSTIIKRLDYSGSISLEMKSGITNNDIKTLEKNLKVFVQYYSDK